MRKHWQTLDGVRYQTDCLDMQLSLGSDGELVRIPVRLRFARGLNQASNSLTWTSPSDCVEGVFRALIADAIDGLQEAMGDATVMGLDLGAIIVFSTQPMEHYEEHGCGRG